MGALSATGKDLQAPSRGTSGSSAFLLAPRLGAHPLGPRPCPVVRAFEDLRAEGPREADVLGLRHFLRDSDEDVSAPEGVLVHEHEVILRQRLSSFDAL